MVHCFGFQAPKKSNWRSAPEKYLPCWVGAGEAALINISCGIVNQRTFQAQATTNALNQALSSEA